MQKCDRSGRRSGPTSGDRCPQERDPALAEADDQVLCLGSIFESGVLNALYANSYAYLHGHEVGGTTDEARWFPLDEVAGLPRVELVDVGLRLLADPATT